MTARTSAHLAFELDDYYDELTRSRGIDCDFRRVDGYLVPAWPQDVTVLRREFAAATQAGFVDVEWLDYGPGPWDDRPALRFPRQARFHPLKYLHGLLALLRTHGVRVYGFTPVGSLEESDRTVVATCGEGRRISAQAVVVAYESGLVQPGAGHV